MKKTAVRIEHLTVYYGNTPAISDICLNVEEGEFLAIMGPNGGGKSTLLKSILGLIPIMNGTIRICDQVPGKNKTMIGYVPQFAVMDKHFPISVLEVVLTGRMSRGLALFSKFSKDDRELAYEKLKIVGLEKLSGRQIGELSGGEFQRLLIARALAVGPKLMLLDEPTASVDAASREHIYAVLEKLNKEMTIILVTHDLLAISSKVRRLACLNGTLVYHGEPELTQHVVNQLYGCPVDLIAHGVPHRVLSEHKEGSSNDSGII